MKTIKLLYLYYDLMNLYGDNGNIHILEKELSRQKGVSLIIELRSVGDIIDFMEYDFIYIGAGTEKNQLVMLKDLNRYKYQIEEYIHSGKPILLTGNSFEVFGKTLEMQNSEPVNGLEILDFKTTLFNDERISCDVVYLCKNGENIYKAIGYINKASKITCNKNITPLFHVLYGVGNGEGLDDDNTEGFIYNNLVATHLSGPVLVKNPWLLESFCKLILSRRGLAYHSFVSENQTKAYKTTLNELMVVKQFLNA